LTLFLIQLKTGGQSRLVNGLIAAIPDSVADDRIHNALPLMKPIPLVFFDVERLFPNCWSVEVRFHFQYWIGFF